MREPFFHIFYLLKENLNSGTNYLKKIQVQTDIKYGHFL